MFGLKLGDALVVLGALLDHVGQGAGAFVEVFADVVDRLAQRQQHLAQPLIFGLARHQLFLDPAEARQLLAHLRDAARQRLAVAHAGALGLALRLQPRLRLLIQQHHNFVFELLQRLLDLRELGQLRLGVGQAAFQILNAARLLLVLDDHALQTLIEPGNLFTVAAVFFVQPGHHLAQLRQVHGSLSRRSIWLRSIIPSFRSETAKARNHLLIG